MATRTVPILMLLTSCGFRATVGGLPGQGVVRGLGRWPRRLTARWRSVRSTSAPRARPTPGRAAAAPGCRRRAVPAGGRARSARPPGAAPTGCVDPPGSCLLYTSDAADEEDSVDLGGRRIIK